MAEILKPLSSGGKAYIRCSNSKGGMEVATQSPFVSTDLDELEISCWSLIETNEWINVTLFAPSTQVDRETGAKRKTNGERSPNQGQYLIIHQPPLQSPHHAESQ